ncbi:MAG: hypothetical protein FWD02_02015 [Bacteroidales bacterium]|nr:hypothetical protein [Bacteroidales bacterium]
MKTLKLTTIALILIAVFTACRSQHPTIQAGSERVTIPFQSREFRTDENNFRAVNTGNSVDYAMARRIAMQNARTELASGIEAVVKAVTEQYADQRQVGNRQEFQTRLEELSRTVVNQRLNDVRELGTEVFREQDGRITVWVAIEMPKDALVNSLNDRLSRDERLRLDFDQHLFRQTFDAEMRKFQENR